MNTTKRKSRALPILAALLASVLTGNVAHATIVESFDSGSFGPGWSDTSIGFINPGAAHSGAYGISMDSSNWSYNTSLSFLPGNTLSAWFRPSSDNEGRFYLGFNADPSGANSFIAATNTGDIRFQKNEAYGFETLSLSAQSWSNQWYLLTVTLSASGTSAVGNLYGSNGTTLLNSLTQTFEPRSGSGIALRSFGGFDIDEVAITGVNGGAVPEPSTYGIIGAGALIGLVALRRRKQTSGRS